MNKLNFSSSYWAIQLGTVCCSIAIAIAIPNPILPQTNLARAQKSIDPLRGNFEDPLIPKGYRKRPLTSFEKYRLTQEIERLQAEAIAAYEKGKIDRSFELWYRQLRLTRVLGLEREIVSLGEIGAIAWQENRGEDLRNIANRLLAIETTRDTEEELSSTLFKKLATAYQQVRYLDRAIEVYQFLLGNKSFANNGQNRDNILIELAELRLATFDYQNAGKLYQKLLDDNISPEDKEVQLIRLVEIYQQANSNSKAIATRTKLIDLYRTQGQNTQIPLLKIANARDLQSIGKLNLAKKTYREGLAQASNLGHLALAAEALEAIATIERKQKNLDGAIDNYEQLLKIYDRTGNYYDAIAIYDALGEIYLKTQQKQKAISAFKRGLATARTFNYKVKYFQHKIEKIN